MSVNGPDLAPESPGPAPPPDGGVFASRRERRLWSWTALTIAGVYSTLGLTAVFPETLYSQGFAAVAFVAAMVLIGVTVLTQGLGLRPRGVEVGAALGIVIVYAMVIFRMAIPERSHIIEYSVVAVFLYEALLERRGAGRRVPAPWLLAVVATSLVGAVDEALQLLLPHRVFDATDMLFNSMAGVGAVGAMTILRWIRGRTSTVDRNDAGTPPDSGPQVGRSL